MSLRECAITNNLDELYKLIANGQLQNEKYMTKDTNGIGSLSIALNRGFSMFYASCFNRLDILELFIGNDSQCNLTNEDIINNINHLKTQYVGYDAIKLSYNILFQRAINGAVNDIISLI